MKKRRIIGIWAFLLSGIIFMNSCLSTTVSASTVSGGDAVVTVSGNDVETTVSGNNPESTVSGMDSETTMSNSHVAKEEIIELTQEFKDTIVTMFGPADSFPYAEALSISVSEIDEKTAETVETAIMDEAQKLGKEIKSYQAFDIKLMADGREVQPLGPVYVTFAKEVVENLLAAEPTTLELNEDTITEPTTAEEIAEKIEVFHVDETTGVVQNMEAEITEVGEVVMETDHFSVYVIINTGSGVVTDTIKLTIEHYGKIYYISEDLSAEAEGDDNIFNENEVGGDYINTTFDWYSKPIYSTDVKTIRNGTRYELNELSKLYQAGSIGTRYDIEGVYEVDDAGKESKITQSITLEKDTTIRFRYVARDNKDALTQAAAFFDYNVTNGYLYPYEGSFNYTKRFEPSSQENGSNGKKKYYIDADMYGINYVLRNATGNKILRVGMPSSGVTPDNGIYMTGSKNPIKNLVASELKNGNVAKGSAVDMSVDFLPMLFTNSDMEYKDSTDGNKTKYGKRYYNNFELKFNQYGDTYTLSSVYDKTTGQNTVDGLENLQSHETYVDASKNKFIYSNMFWPLDQLTDYYAGRDPLMGAYDENNLNNVYSSNIYAPKYYKASTIAGNDENQFWQSSESNNAHNWFFGMRYDFTFTIGDYEGPLNFYFRGDDDFWLYLDGERQVDIGGIHSSIGESLNIKELLKLETDEEAADARTKAHTISIFYTERGGTGSCCYMQFTLPNVQPLNIDSTVEQASVSVRKVWNDGDNAAGLRPSEIEVEMWQENTDTNGKVLLDTKKLNEANEWNYTWSELLRNNPATGNPYHYYVQEKTLGTYEDSYETITDNGVTSVVITNTLLTEHSVKKIWQDGNNYEGTRPSSIQVKLQQNNQDYDSNGDGICDEKDLIELTSSGQWAYTWSGLPKYDLQGRAYEYSVIEVEVPNGYEAVVTDGSGKTTITNVLQTSISVEKIWSDNDDINDLRPDNIKVQLKQNGNNCKDPVTLTESGKWTYTWTGLDKYDSDGNTYVYTVVEMDVPANYDVVYNPSTGISSGKITITNTLELTELTVTKVWNGDQEVNQSDKPARPESVFVWLCKANGSSWEKVKEATLEAVSWTAAFTNLPVKDVSGNRISYRVFEVQDGNVLEQGATFAGENNWNYSVDYSNAENHWTITNTLQKTSLTLTKRIDQMDKENATAIFRYLITGPNDYKADVTVNFEAGTIKLNGTTVSTDGDDDINNNVGFDKAGLSVTIQNLQPGTYSVIEYAARGYELVKRSTEDSTPSSDAQAINGVQNPISAAATVDAPVTVYYWNRYKVPTDYTAVNRFSVDSLGGKVSISVKKKSD